MSDNYVITRERCKTPHFRNVPGKLLMNKFRDYYEKDFENLTDELFDFTIKKKFFKFFFD